MMTNNELAERFPNVPKYKITKYTEILDERITETGKEYLIELWDYETGFDDDEPAKVNIMMSDEGFFEDEGGTAFILDSEENARCYFRVVKDLRPTDERKGINISTL